MTSLRVDYPWGMYWALMSVTIRAHQDTKAHLLSITVPLENSTAPPRVLAAACIWLSGVHRNICTRAPMVLFFFIYTCVRVYTHTHSYTCICAIVHCHSTEKCTVIPSCSGFYMTPIKKQPWSQIAEIKQQRQGLRDYRSRIHRCLQPLTVRSFKGPFSHIITGQANACHK